MSVLIISDFDGTITKQDVNDQLFLIKGDEVSQQIERDFINGKVGNRETIIRHFKRLKMTADEYFAFIDKHIEIDPNFKEFYQQIQQSTLQFAIVSGGFINYIDYILKRTGIDFTDQIYANRLIFAGDQIRPEFLHEINDCYQDFGVCGNCKYQLMRQFKDKYDKLIYIGDGLTDRCVVDEVDFLLAKKDSSLEKYCQENGFDFISFVNFAALSLDKLRDLIID